MKAPTAYLLLFLAAACDVNASQLPVPTPTQTTQSDVQDAMRIVARQETTAISRSSTIRIPNNAAAGGLSYTRPAITDAISYYKIMENNPITFGWNFTSLYVTPTALTFEARCSANSYTYAVGPATGIPGGSTQIVWDPYADQQQAGAVPFAQASYTLRVYDERGVDAVATGGYFYGSNSLVVFAMYSPAAYTPLAAGWTCVSCSLASLSATLSHPLLVALPVTLAFVLIGGAGVLYR